MGKFVHLDRGGTCPSRPNQSDSQRMHSSQNMVAFGVTETLCQSFPFAPAYLPSLFSFSPPLYLSRHALSSPPPASLSTPLLIHPFVHFPSTSSPLTPASRLSIILSFCLRVRPHPHNLQVRWHCAKQFSYPHSRPSTERNVLAIFVGGMWHFCGATHEFRVDGDLNIQLTNQSPIISSWQNCMYGLKQIYKNEIEDISPYFQPKWSDLAAPVSRKLY